MQQELPPAQEKISSAVTRLKKTDELHRALKIAREGLSRSERSRELSPGHCPLHFSPSFVLVRSLQHTSSPTRSTPGPSRAFPLSRAARGRSGGGAGGRGGGGERRAGGARAKKKGAKRPRAGGILVPRCRAPLVRVLIGRRRGRRSPAGRA